MYRALGSFVTAFLLAFSLLGGALAQTSAEHQEWSSSNRTKFRQLGDTAELTAFAEPPAQSFPTSFSRPVAAPAKRERFHWGPAIGQSLNFLAVQQGIMLATDNQARFHVSHGVWFKDYMRSVKGNTHWDDGDPFLDNYVGHPMQGAISGFVQVQNDPAGRRLEFANTKAYWKSRMKSMAWNAVYSAQFEIGPLGEASIENLGSYQYRNCATCKPTNGAGFVDFVITPTVGTAWLVAEDLLDKYIPGKIERVHGRSGWTNLLRCLVNPSRTAANMLARKAPWYRASRDEQK